MDIFKRMNQRTTTDFSVFKPKKTNQLPAAEPPKKAEEPILVPKEAETNDILKPESVAQTEKVETVAELAKDLNSDMEKQKAVKEQRIVDDEKTPTKVIQFKKPENIGEEASVKLEAELETSKSTLLPVFPIVRYLKNKCLADESFAALVMEEKKTLKKCFDYVTGEVKKALNSQNGWLDDDEVYAYAETYYMTSEEEFERRAKEKAEEEKKQREAVAKKRKEQEEKRKKAAAEKKKAGTDKTVTEKVKAEAEEKGIPKEEAKSKKAPKTEEQEVPVMQEQLCLEL